MPRCCSPLLLGQPRTLMNLSNSAQRTYAQWEFGSFASAAWLPARGRDPLVANQLAYGRATGRGPAGRARADRGFGEVVVSGVRVSTSFKHRGLDMWIEGACAAGGCEG